MMDRIERSFRLVAQSYRILVQDRELMVLPLLSGMTTLLVVAVGVLGLRLWQIDPGQMGRGAYAAGFAVYVVTYAIGIFFQAAVIAGATDRMRGGDPTIRSALAAAARRWGAILMWALVAATVGMVLRAIADRSGLLGKFVAGLAGAAWSLATLFVVPVIVLEDRAAGGALARSTELFRDTWGEVFVGGLGFGAAAACLWVVLLALAGAVGSLNWVLGLVLFAAGAISLMILFSSLQGVYLASLYRFATEGERPAGFDAELVNRAFTSTSE